MAPNSNVLIIGGGVAGLTAATLLIEAGFNVTIIEASDSLGGLAKSKINSMGFPTEHSIRAMNDNFIYFFHTLKKFIDLKSILSKISVTLEAQDKKLFPLKPGKGLLARLHNFHVINKLIKEKKINPFEVLTLMPTVLYYHFACEKRLEKKAQKCLEEYFKSRSDSFRNIFMGFEKLAFAATNETSCLLGLYYHGEHSLFDFHYYMFNGPTSEVLINSWEKYLTNKGVTIQLNSSVSQFIHENKNIKSAVLTTGENLNHDIYLYAGSSISLNQIFKNTTSEKNLTHKFNEVCATGIQIYLNDLPKEKIPGILYCFIDSPWKVSGVIQGPPFWLTQKWKNNLKYVFSVVIDDFFTPGIKHTKPAVECSEEEIFEEILAQTNLTNNELALGFHLSDGLKYYENNQYLKLKETLPPHLAYQRRDLSWIINFTPYFLPTCEDIKFAPNSKTSFNNLYLAGHFCKTHMPIPTMEKASESAYWACDALLKDWKKDYRHTYPKLDYNKRKNSIIRTIDSFIYKIFGK